MSQASPPRPGLTPEAPGLHLTGCPASGACGNVAPGRTQAHFSCSESLCSLTGPGGVCHPNGQAAQPTAG